MPSPRPTILAMTESGWPALSLDGLEAVVFDTDGVLTDTASVHAAAWKRLFDHYLRRRGACGSEPPKPCSVSLRVTALRPAPVRRAYS